MSIAKNEDSICNLKTEYCLYLVQVRVMDNIKRFRIDFYENSCFIQYAGLEKEPLNVQNIATGTTDPSVGCFNRSAYFVYSAYSDYFAHFV